MQVAQDTTLEEIASQIEAYLDTRPHAADTVEGMATWWLARPRISEAVERAQQAPDLMIEADRITIRRGPDDTILYSRVPERLPVSWLT